MIKTILFFTFCLTLAMPAHAYIDPGSGGYLITSLIAWIGGGLAMSAAFIIHFFRFTLKKFILTLWSRYRWQAVFAFLLIVVGLCWGGYFLLGLLPQDQGGLVVAEHVAS